MIVYHSIRLQTIWWPFSFTLFFWGGLPILFAIGYITVVMRTLVDSADTARRKAEQAERQTAIVYDQQLQLNQLKDHFIAHVSHELRTPLAVLGGSLELLKVQGENLKPMEQFDPLAEALVKHEQLVCLVNRIVEATAIAKELPSAHYEFINVCRFVQGVLAHLNPVDLRAYTVRLQIAQDVMVWADRHYLCQVLDHLFSNVFKYVPKQTQITIAASHVVPSARVCLSVQDAGPGIPSDEQPLLFEKFARLKRDLAGPISGMGLGLFVCKHLVEAMGGQIWVESSGRMGEGSRFCFTLPSSFSALAFR